MPRHGLTRSDRGANGSVSGVDANEETETNSNRLPLKKGDACQHCRVRRRKCSAEKPSCAQCRKLNRECVYDTGKPVSRVKQLEAKVGELQKVIDSISRPYSGSVSLPAPSSPTSQRNLTGLRGDVTAVQSALHHTSSYQQTIPHPSAHNTLHSMPHAQSSGDAITHLFDVTPSSDPSGDPNTTANNSAHFDVSQHAGSSQTAPHLSPTPAVATTPNMFDWSSLNSTSLTSFLNINDMLPSATTPIHFPSTSGSASLYDLPHSGTQPTLHDALQSTADQTLSGGWFDPADLPTIARDHLLNLFFDKMRFLGQGIHIPQFFASLTLTPSKRPHRSLLYSMYLLACKASTSPSIRVLDNHFLTICLKSIDEGIARVDRLFDVLRACNMVAVHYYGAGRVYEGWVMAGKAARLCISCGLHKIPSSVFQGNATKGDVQDGNLALKRTLAWNIPSPQDAAELGERIWAFWAIYLTDRSAAISSMCPCVIPDEIICTPFPRPLYEYELRLPTKNDDRTVSSIWTCRPASPMTPHDDSSYMNCLFRSLAIFDRASKLITLDPEAGFEDRIKQSSSESSPFWPTTTPRSDFEEDAQYRAIFRELDGMQATNESPRLRGGGKGSMQTARIRTPKAYAQIKDALERLEGDLIPELRTDWYTWDGVTPKWFALSTNGKDLYNLHFSIGCSWMFLFDVPSFSSPNTLAVGCARRMVCAVARATEVINGSDMDVFTIMTWSYICQLLKREVKRLHALGDFRTAASIEADSEVVVSAMKKCGQKMNLALDQVYNLERSRSFTSEDTMFDEDEELSGWKGS
ncbi:hypothetical protein CI109_102036 [Kwoniella shandongensis]|uniref:Uncharacterized protein n=1 Tax=Kwoniella shandongensis TaxID=1734106 RepID=A0A5M6BNK8_9TREE|nr:uncharacterized protein CI109_007385 [Kwoniella shandongensis]KAA5524293.1 hypothetical protein CI109_007385 [Kwoniella shandongensis]